MASAMVTLIRNSQILTGLKDRLGGNVSLEQKSAMTDLITGFVTFLVMDIESRVTAIGALQFLLQW
jgi:hypothetical protein